MATNFCLVLLSGFAAFSSGFHHHDSALHLLSSRPLKRLSTETKVGPILEFSTVKKTVTYSSTNSEHDQSVSEPILEPFGVGVWRDFSRRFPLYVSDFKDGLNAQTVATTLFLFFACATPAIGFGSISDIATKGDMGVIEMVASTAICGILCKSGQIYSFDRLWAHLHLLD
jgi:hypothetical protein